MLDIEGQIAALRQRLQDNIERHSDLDVWDVHNALEDMLALVRDLVEVVREMRATETIKNGED